MTTTTSPEYYCQMKKPHLKLTTAFPEQSANFIHLKNKTFAEYNIIYHINDCYSITELSQIKSVNQLLFQRFDNKIQQLNLVIVDSTFPAILADVAINVLLGKVSCFNGYINQQRQFVFVDSQMDKLYFRNKFKFFLHKLLFSNVALAVPCDGEEDLERIYYRKGDGKKIEYYPIFRQIELQEMSLSKIRLAIDLKDSFIYKSKVEIRLQAYI